MEKRSRRHIRDLVALAASQGLSQNEIGCARISMMARSTNAPFKGRIQKRKTNRLQIIKSSLQRTAGPYKRARSEHHRWKGDFAGAAGVVSQSVGHPKRTWDIAPLFFSHCGQFSGGGVTSSWVSASVPRLSLTPVPSCNSKSEGAKRTSESGALISRKRPN